MARSPLDPARLLRATAIVAASITVATGCVAVLEGSLGLGDASGLYLLAVVAVAAIDGTWSAVAASVAAFLVYDFFFIDPRYTLTVADPQEWLELVLFLVVAIVTGRLAGLQRDRAEEAVLRARESRALFFVSRTLATADRAREALPTVLEHLCTDTRMSRVWIGVGSTAAQERVIADSGGDGAQPPERTPPTFSVLRRTPGDEPAEWVRTHTSGTPAARGTERASTGSSGTFRVAITADTKPIGSLWAVRPYRGGVPDRAETRILSAAADQIGQVLRRDRLAADATDAEIVRRSDALKSSLLDSVSHDLRTPLAAIRAAAGNLADPEVAWTADEGRRMAASIDTEAERLDRIVRNVLDLSRIEAGNLRPELEPYDVADLVEPVVERLRPRLAGHSLALEVPTTLPPVLADGVYADQVLTNLLENAAKYVPPGAAIRVSASPADAGRAVRITVEDAGPGVADEDLGRLTERFFRARRQGGGSRPGLGIGLTVVRGFVEAMGGRLELGRSELGGLSASIELAAAEPRVSAPES